MQGEHRRRQVEKDMHWQGGDLEEKEEEIKDLVGGGVGGRQQLQRAQVSDGERKARGPRSCRTQERTRWGCCNDLEILKFDKRVS